MDRATFRAALLVLTCAALGAGCKKDHQSLVVASLKLRPGTPAATGLKSVTLTATPGSSETFTLTMLSADTPAKFGLWLSGDITGDVAIVAAAVPASGCAGFRGNGGVRVDAAGLTRSLDITMETDPNSCPPDGGTPGRGGAGGGGAGTGGGAGAGTGGGAGAGGGPAGTGGSSSAGAGGNTAGSGGRGGSAGGAGGMAGYPSIANCRTFAHAATNCPNVSVNGVAISPNGQIVASAGDDGRVKIWSFDGRQLTATTTMLTGFLGDGLAFSPDGTRLAYASTDGAVRTYTVNGWAAGPTLQDDGSRNTLRGVAFTPDSQRVVSVNHIGFAGGDVFVHNLGGSTLPATTAHVANEPYSLAVSPRAAADGSIGVAVGSYYGTSTVLSLGPSGFDATATNVPASINTRTTYTVRFSPDGSQYVTGEDYGVVRFFAYPLANPPAPMGSMITFSGGDSVKDVAFSPSGKYVAIGGAFYNGQLSIYDAATHAELDRATPEYNVTSLVFAPNGGAIIGGEDGCGYVLVCN